MSNIFNMDCVEFMKGAWITFYKNKVDLVIADPHIMYQEKIILIR